MFAVAGGSPGHAACEVRTGGVGVGGVIVDAACEGCAGDGSADAVGVGCVVVVLGVDGVGVGGAPGVVVVGGAAGGVLASGAGVVLQW